MMFKDLFKQIKDGYNNPSYKYDLDDFIPKYFEVSDINNTDDEGNKKVFYKTNDCLVCGMNSEEEAELFNFLIEKYHYNSLLGVKLNQVYRDTHISTGSHYQFDMIVSKKYNLYEVVILNKYLLFFQCFTKDTGKNFEGCRKLDNAKSSGVKSMEEINEMGRQKGLWKHTMYQYFVDEQYKDYKYMIKLCVPNQIGYMCNKTEVVIPYCHKADVSSAFPAQLTLRIPILRDIKVVEGDTTPTDEYPFVFTYEPGKLYGRIQILETNGTYIDTDADLNNKFMREVKMQLRLSETRRMYVSGTYTENGKSYSIKLPTNKVSVCCHSSKVSLKAIMEELYQVKLNGTTPEEIQRAKDTMNSFIGYTQLNTSPNLAFIAAVVIARQNHKMLERCQKLEEEGNQICYIATDSIVWKGDSSKIATERKFLGSFTKEYEYCKFYGIQVGAYQIETADGKVKTWCTYIENGDIKNNIPFGKLPRPKESMRSITNE